MLTEACGGHDDVGQATERLLDYYQHAAARAGALISRLARPARAAVADGPVPAAVPALAGQEQALAWLRAERGTLLACLDYATAAGQHARVTALTGAVAGLLHIDGPWTEAVIRHTAAVQAARHLGDRLSQANALHNLGSVRPLTDDYSVAAPVLEQALGIYRDLGERLGQASALDELGTMRANTGDYPGVARDLEQALGIYRDLGDRRGQASALNELGAVRWLTDDYPAATQALEQALAIYRDLGERLGRAFALTLWGTSGE